MPVLIISKFDEVRSNEGMLGTSFSHWKNKGTLSYYD